MSIPIPAPIRNSHSAALPTIGGAGPGDPYREPPSGPGAAQQIQRYLGAAMRYKWLILAFCILGTAAGVFASRYSKPVYESQAIFWVEVNTARNTSGPIRTGELLQSSAWIDLLRSYVVLDHVVRDQRLFVETDFANRGVFRTFELQESFRPGRYRLEVAANGETFVLTSQGTQIQRGRVGEAIGSQVGFNWTPGRGAMRGGRTIDFTIYHPRDAAVRLGNELRATLSSEGNFLRISLSGTDPEQISSTLNAVSERYVAVAADIKRAQLDELTGVLDEQRRYAEDNLRDTELQLEQFRVATVTLPSDRGGPIAAGLEQTQDPVMSRYFALQAEMDQYRNDREAIGRILAESSNAPQSLDALSMIATARGSAPLTAALSERMERRAEYRAAQQRYTADHPTMTRLAQNIEDLEQRAIPRLARDLQTQILARENELRSRIGSASDELRQIPPRAIEEARLQRQVAIAENLHGMLKQRFEEVRLSAASTIPDIRVLDPAVVPTRPSRDPGNSLIVFGFLGGLGLSIAGVILRDRFDTRVRYPDEVTYGMGLAILGAVPSIRQVAGSRDNDSSQAAEAFREIRMNLLYAHGTAGTVMLTITSPGSGDGKSFISSNLALSFADQGYATLVVDGDVRRGVLHRTLGTTRVPGLTDYLAGHAALEDVVRPTQYANVHLIPAGTRMKDGPELLGSDRMAKLLVALKGRFGAIIVDSPPLGAGVDAFGLATLTQNLVMVLRTGATDRALATSKLGMIDRLPIRLLGAVMNGTPSNSGIYRYYSYLPGYTIAAEEEQEEPQLTPGAESKEESGAAV
jgi:polysaccharide biosynthesis transport protein